MYRPKVDLDADRVQDGGPGLSGLANVLNLNRCRKLIQVRVLAVAVAGVAVIVAAVAGAAVAVLLTVFATDVAAVLVVSVSASVIARTGAVIAILTEQVITERFSLWRQQPYSTNRTE